MLRRKPTKIGVKIDDKEELEEFRRRAAVAASATTTTSTGATSLLHHFDQDSSSSKPNRIYRRLFLILNLTPLMRLPDSTTHNNLQTLLSPFHVVTHWQYNTFFDGSSAELSSKCAVLRLRFYNEDSKCVVSLKPNPYSSTALAALKKISTL